MNANQNEIGPYQATASGRQMGLIPEPPSSLGGATMSANKKGIGPCQAAAGGRQSEGMRRALHSLVTFLALCSLMLLVLSCSASHELAEPVAVQPTPDSITITLQTPLHHITAGSDGFALVQIEGFDRFASPGDPALPGKVYNVALPPDVAWQSVTVEMPSVKTVELADTYEIAPAPPPATWVDGQQIIDWGENAASIVDGKNTKVYQHDAYFPSSYVTSVDQSQMRKWRFVKLLFTPVQYNPVTKKLRVATEVEVRIAFGRRLVDQAQMQAELSDTVMDAEAARILYNYDQAKVWYQR